MNQHLQTLLDYIQESEKLSSEEKNDFVNSLKAVDKELEIISFKLDRTEKVKRTTAILLEETIEELEQKRKAVEAQNRKLEIEAALERVRFKALGMTKPEDMVDICQIISTELESLNVKDIRNVQTAIFYPEKGTYFNYEYYTRHDKGLVTEVDYRTHELQVLFANQMQQGAGELFTYPLKDKELKDWYDYQKTTNQFVDVYLETTNSLTYYWYSLGPVALGISTYSPLNEAEIGLFKNFRNVFDLAYRRFIDIELAIFQAREARIEAALERVRSRTMAMQKSEELQAVIRVVNEQLVNLNILVDHSGFILDYKESEDMNIWLADPNEVPFQVTIPYFDSPHWNSFIEAKRNKKDFFANHLSFEEKNRFYKDLFKFFPVPDEARDYYFGCPGLAISTVLLDSIGLYIENFSGIPYSDEDNKILMRFGNVFEQSYTRFLDLQKAENQAREVKVDLALEKIRAKVTSMQESSELLDIVVSMRNEFVSLGHEAHYFWYMRWLPDKYEKAMTSGDGNRIGKIMTLPRHIHGDIKLLADWEKSEESSVVFAMDVETALNYLAKMISLGDFQQVDHSTPILDAVRHIGGLTFVMARTAHGEIGYSLPGMVPDPPADDVAALVRFAGVFDLAYRRFEDLKIAEAHAVQAEEDLVKLQTEKLRAEEALAELQVTQKQLIQSEKMASLGELTAGIAHEIQNPLNFVNNFSEVSAELVEEMKQELAVGSWQLAGEIADDIKQNLEKINHHGKRADAIVKGMLQHSRTSSGVKEPTDINALADEYLRLAYHGLRAKDKDFNAVLKTDFDKSIGNINIIPQDIGRVILNLITNAFYAVDEKKKQLASDLSALSNLTGQNAYEPTVTVSTTGSHSTQGEGRSEVLIIVQDNGNGIPKKILEKIFQPFFTTKPTGEGTGLGLSLSYDIVKAHGGELKVETKDGEGSIFKITLPIT